MGNLKVWWRKEYILAEAFLIRRRRKRRRIRRGQEGVTHGDRWWIRQQQSLGGEEEVQESDGAQKPHTEGREQKGAQGDWSTRCKSCSSLIHHMGMEALGSDHHPRCSQDKPDPQKRLIQSLVSQEPCWTGMPKWVPTLDRQAAVPLTAASPPSSLNKSVVGKVWILSLRSVQEFSWVQRIQTQVRSCLSRTF